MSQPKTVLRLELGFKKLAIADAIMWLQEEQARGATHVAGMRVRWEESADRPLGHIRAAIPDEVEI